MRIYFVTDVHGSEVCFRKFLNSHAVYDADVMIVGGDITGKVLVPLIQHADGSATGITNHGEVPLGDEPATIEFERQIADVGSYTWRCSADEYDAARADPDLVDRLFSEAVRARVRAWTELAAERLRDARPRVFMSGGNDDFWEIDEELRSAARVECPDRAVVDLGEGVDLLSFGAANQTPWDCPRDLPEEELQSVIDDLAGQLRGGPAVFNLHVPPYDTLLDAGPALDADNRPRLGMSGVESAPVGSHAVRSSIERYRPFLSLHGHVHESRASAQVGQTLAINPGSEYAQGLLRGALIDIEGGRVKRHQLLCG